jgi:hypothetical protein
LGTRNMSDVGGGVKQMGARGVEARNLWA